MLVNIPRDARLPSDITVIFIIIIKKIIILIIAYKIIEIKRLKRH